MSIKRKIRILTIQYSIRYLNIHGNLLRFGRILDNYKYLKPDLVIFPEYSLTGPLYGNYHMAFNEHNAIFEKLSVFAQKYQINLIPGSFVRKDGRYLYNSTCFISPKGQILGYYDKEHLWSSERRYLKKGVKNKPFKTSLGTIAVQICADLHSSLISHNYRSFEPDLIINLAMWSHEDIKANKKSVPKVIEFTQTELLARARAIENRCYSVFCNFAGTVNIKAKSGRTYRETSIGNSMMVNPYGEVIGKSSTNRESVLFAELDLNKCHWSKYKY